MTTSASTSTGLRHPQDPLLAELIGELTMKSPEFVALRGDHRVASCDVSPYYPHHPVVGTVTCPGRAGMMSALPGQCGTRIRTCPQPRRRGSRGLSCSSPPRAWTVPPRP
ncbi:hypothetical protein ABZ816_23865 [Actinosynnema sp. NPDC047251]|uniref:MmyB family transcriptional regulator n=1 Tax=Saccharothrix espanaensis TaxID=103731 RepID=UPI0018D37C26